MTDQTTAEDVQQTLQAYLTTATNTGELRGARVEFTEDGTTWSELLILDEGAYPVAARATVHRADWELPTVVTELWGEVLPAEDTWRALWQSRPHVLFGAHALRSALRRAFADVLGARREPDDLPTGEPAPAAADAVAEPAPARDWQAEIARAATLDELNDVRRKARSARAMTIDLKQALDARRAELTPIPAEPTPEPRNDAAETAAPKRQRSRHRPKRKPEKVRENAPETSVAAAMRDALAKVDGETS